MLLVIKYAFENHDLQMLGAIKQVCVIFHPLGVVGRGRSKSQEPIHAFAKGSFLRRFKWRKIIYLKKK